MEGIAVDHVFPILDISIHLGDIHNQNHAECCTFLAPIFLGGRPPKYFDLDYKIEHTSDQSCGKVSGQLAEAAWRSHTENKEKKRRQNKTPGTCVPGGLKMLYSNMQPEMLNSNTENNLFQKNTILAFYHQKYSTKIQMQVNCHQYLF